MIDKVNADVVCIFPIVQQIVGIASIVFNIVKIARESFLFLHYSFSFVLTVSFPYPLVNRENLFDWSPANERIRQIEEDLSKKETNTERLKILSKELKNINARLEKGINYLKNWRSQNKRIACCFDNMKIGFYRSIPVFGTIYSLKMLSSFYLQKSGKRFSSAVLQ